MKKILSVFVVLICFSTFAQNLEVVNAISSNSLESTKWGNDVTILNAEPIGNFSGVQGLNSKIYLAVNDTSATTNLGLVILSSTNDGENWSLYPSGIPYRGIFQKIKLVRSGLDSIYCFFQVENELYSWNIASSSLYFVLGSVKSFDVTALSNGNLHIMFDTLGKNTIYKWGSINGGVSWVKGTSITSNGAYPTVTSGGTPDTLIVNYWGPVVAVDSSLSLVRAFRYRESTTTPGLLQYLSPSLDLAFDTTQHKDEYMSAYKNGEAWFIYTKGNHGARDIHAKLSTNNAVSYLDSFVLAYNPNVDEYWFDIKTKPFGFDLVYFSDSTNPGPVSNDKQMLYVRSVNNGSNTFSEPKKISENPPFYSAKNYKPQIIELPYSGNDFGVVWVADVSGQKKLAWDRDFAVVPVELTSFNASLKEGIVNLSWSTSTENNNDGFDVERKINGVWNKIIFVKGKGTSTENNYYSLIDDIKNLSVKTISYRLKQIDLDGSFNYSNIIEVENSTPSTFSISQNYPNPFNPVTTINYSLPVQSFVRLSVHNILGEEIKLLVNENLSQGYHEVNFDASSLSSGLYLYKIEISPVNEGAGFTSVKKMMLMK